VVEVRDGYLHTKKKSVLSLQTMPGFIAEQTLKRKKKETIEPVNLS
jgi:hypothetical protein